ncbi:MAG: PKD domain-containing protein, partial [Saprospiraceae bacterium]|nr:PKD domain-containing protein [Saprospiraceae bacterium]
PASGCEPLVVAFINESSQNSEFFFWEFPGGSPSTSSIQNPVVVYEDPGFYTVTLTVENQAGQDVLVLQDYIEVLAVAQAQFDVTINGMTAEFTNNSQNAQDYLWIFGDGASSTATDPIHTYSEGGQYEVLLIASNTCSSDTAVIVVSINAPPTAAFSTSPEAGCPGLTVSYTNTSSGAETYAWTFPGGTPATSSAENPVVVYNTPGTYAAQLIVTNAIGADTTIIDPAVIIEDPVESAFTYTTNGATVDFLNLSVNATGYLWNIDGVLFVDENPSYTFMEDGDYEIKLIAAGPCGPDTSVQIVHIATLPTAGFSVAGPTTGCVPLTVQFTNMSSANAITFAWVFEGGTPATSSAPNPVVQYSTPGTYNVSLTVWSEIGSDEMVMNDLIVVLPDPEAGFQTIQDGLQVEFVNISEDADSYEWFFGDGAGSVEPDPVHIYDDFGTYQVMLVASNTCGSDTFIMTLELATIPVPMFMAAQPTGCAPFEVQFTDMSQNGAESWQWAFPGGIPDSSNEQNPLVVYPAPGVYSVTLIVANSAGSQALVREDYIVVGEPPQAGFAATVDGATVSFENTSIGADDYLWLFGDGESDTMAHPVYEYAATGTYLVQLIALNACGADTTELWVEVMTTSLSDPVASIDCTIYPNPNSGRFHLQFANATGQIDLRVYNLLGRVVYARSGLAIEGNAVRDQDLGDMIPGIYYVEVRQGRTRMLRRIAVQ